MMVYVFKVVLVYTLKFVPTKIDKLVFLYHKSILIIIIPLFFSKIFLYCIYNFISGVDYNLKLIKVFKGHNSF